MKTNRRFSQNVSPHSSPRHVIFRVAQLVKLLEEKRIELSPVFQRSSVWRPSQRWNLLETIFRGYPIPAIFLVEKHGEHGFLSYDVIDGKQRLESIFLFMGLLKGRKDKNERGFSALLPDPNDESGEVKRRCKWKDMIRDGDARCRKLLDYEIPVNVLSSDWGYPDIRQVFIRINSTGTPLNRAELYNARFLKSNFWKICQTSANKLRKIFRNAGVFSDARINRHEHVEFFAQIVMTICKGSIMDKHKGMELALDKTPWTAKEIRAASDKATWAIRRLTRKLLPNIRETRFCHVSDFYSLVWVWVKLDERYALLGEKDIKRAREALVGFSADVDAKDDAWRRGERLTRDADISTYIKSVRANSDGKVQRENRHGILFDLLADIFPPKDSQRCYNQRQRRVIYANSDKRCRCGRKLTLDGMQADHKTPWSKGGRTVLSNADVLCPICNAKKGNR